MLKRINDNDYFIKTVNTLMKGKTLHQFNEILDTSVLKNDVDNGVVVFLHSFKNDLFYFIEKKITDNNNQGKQYNEIYANILVKSLVFQGICPHFNIDYCWNETEKDLLLYMEYINGQNLSEWYKQVHTNDEWYSVFFQILYSLLTLDKYFGMIHGDLHAGNIIIKKIPSGGTWKYKINDKVYSIKNLGYQVCIIDFGYAYIPEKIGVDWYYNDVFSNINKLDIEFFDVYKVLLWILLSKDLPQIFVNNILLYLNKDSFLFTVQVAYSQEHKEFFTKKLDKYTFSPSESLTLLGYFESIYSPFITNDIGDFDGDFDGDGDTEIETKCMDKNVLKFLV